MTAIWEASGDGWKVATPTGFATEAALHDLVEQSPQLLPLSGAPTITVLGREVRLGAGYADLVGVEATGRPVIIEVKLAYNAEARRAVIAQILTYAAALYGIGLAAFEDDVLGKHLRERGHSSIFDAATATDQVGVIDRAPFEAVLSESLKAGEFRLVIVLDEAPPELLRLIAYLEAVADRLTIDLITVRRYGIAGSAILVPQRVEPERHDVETPATAIARRSEGYAVDGPQDFIDRIASAREADRELLTKLADWAGQLQAEGLVQLTTYHGKDDLRLTLLPRLPSEKAGLVTIWNDNGGSLGFYKSVFERCAPQALVRVNELLAPGEVGQGNATRNVTDELLDVLTSAYREAAGHSKTIP
jgi:hypothetical protein